MAKTKEVTEIATPVRIDGIESFIAGFHTVAKGKQSGKQESSQTILSVGIRRPHQPLCYINVRMNTNLTTGLTELESIAEQHTSIFHKSGNLTNFSTTTNKKSSAKPKSVIPAALRKTDPLDDAVDDLLEIVS